jgi:predicted alpha/beta superfamily hydrolase
MKIQSLLAFYFLLFYCGNIFSQSSDTNNNLLDVNLNYSETHVLYSENVQDSFYIYIKLPKYYKAEKDRSYPAIFLLDGDIAFPMAWSVVRYLQFGKYISDVIIVGIGYGGLLYSSNLSKRERDYNISEIDGLDESGGAAEFLNFIKEELMPFLELKYRMDNSNLTLSGHSLGGLFALYTLFSEPHLFSNYIAGSPYISLDVEELLLLEEENKSQIEEAKCSLFITYGSNEEEENYQQPNNKIVDRLLHRDSSYIDFKFKIFEEGNHFSTPAEALAYGLLYTFNYTLSERKSK